MNEAMQPARELLVLHFSVASSSNQYRQTNANGQSQIDPAVSSGGSIGLGNSMVSNNKRGKKRKKRGKKLASWVLVLELNPVIIKEGKKEKKEGKNWLRGYLSWN